MKRIILCCATSLALVACDTVPKNIIAAPPAPLAETRIDDTALIAADRAFGLFNDGVNTLIDLKYLVPGSERAVQIAKWIRITDNALNVAAAAAALGHATDYKTALIEAQQGIAQLKLLLGRK